MPYFVYKINVEREPASGEVAVLSDGIIIKGGDMEYPERYSPVGNYITIAVVNFYTTEGTKIGGNWNIGNIVCRQSQQSEYYPIKE